MTLHTFHAIARKTTRTFWAAAAEHLTPEQRTYLARTPTQNTLLQRRIIAALALTLLPDDQTAGFLRAAIPEDPIRFDAITSDLLSPQHTQEPTT